MADYRTNLYNTYVSRFKSRHLTIRPEKLETYFRWAEKKFQPLLAGVSREAKILELGCGPGYFMEFLKRHGFSQVEGIDISPEQVELAAGRGLPAQVRDVFAFLENPAREYQMIVALDFLEHFTKDEVFRLLGMIYQALSPGGVFLIETPNGEGLFPNQVIYGDLTHTTIFTSSSLSHALKTAGFDEIRCVETGPATHNLSGAIRLCLWKGITCAARMIRRIETGKRQEIWTENLICICRKAG